MTEERLNYREYNAMRGLAAVLSVLPYVGEGLQKRFKDIGEAWTFDRLMADVQHLFDAVVRTVPRNKLFGIKTELQHTKLDIRTDFVGCQHNFDNWVCVKEDALVRIAKAAQGVECEMCMKRGNEVKGCKLRQMLNETLPYTPPKPAAEGTCVYAEQLIETLEGKSVEEMMGEVKV